MGNSEVEAPEVVAGQRIGELRRDLGLSQQRLARSMSERGFGWHQTTVAKTEAGDRPLRVNELVALADIFGIGVAALLAHAGDDERNRAWRALLAATGRVGHAQQELEEAKLARRIASDHFNELQTAAQAGKRDEDTGDGEHQEAT